MNDINHVRTERIVTGINQMLAQRALTIIATIPIQNITLRADQPITAHTIRPGSLEAHIPCFTNTSHRQKSVTRSIKMDSLVKTDEQQIVLIMTTHSSGLVREIDHLLLHPTGQSNQSGLLVNRAGRAADKTFITGDTHAITIQSPIINVCRAGPRSTTDTLPNMTGVTDVIVPVMNGQRHDARMIGGAVNLSDITVQTGLVELERPARSVVMPEFPLPAHVQVSGRVAPNAVEVGVKDQIAPILPHHAVPAFEQSVISGHENGVAVLHPNLVQSQAVIIMNQLAIPRIGGPIILINRAVIANRPKQITTGVHSEIVAMNRRDLRAGRRKINQLSPGISRSWGKSADDIPVRAGKGIPFLLGKIMLQEVNRRPITDRRHKVISDTAGSVVARPINVGPPHFDPSVLNLVVFHDDFVLSEAVEIAADLHEVIN